MQGGDVQEAFFAAVEIDKERCREMNLGCLGCSVEMWRSPLIVALSLTKRDGGIITLGCLGCRVKTWRSPLIVALENDKERWRHDDTGKSGMQGVDVEEPFLAALEINAWMDLRSPSLYCTGY